MPKISIAAARVNVGLTQEQMASKLGVSKNTICNWENGNTEPSLSQLRDICEITKIPLDFISLPEKSN